MKENRKFENYVHLQHFVCDFNLDVEYLSILSQFTSAQMLIHMHTDNMNKIILSKYNQSKIILGKIILSENGSKSVQFWK